MSTSHGHGLFRRKTELFGKRECFRQHRAMHSDEKIVDELEPRRSTSISNMKLAGERSPGELARPFQSHRPFPQGRARRLLLSLAHLNRRRSPRCKPLRGKQALLKSRSSAEGRRSLYQSRASNLRRKTRRPQSRRPRFRLSVAKTEPLWQQQIPRRLI